MLLYKTVAGKLITFTQQSTKFPFSSVDLAFFSQLKNRITKIHDNNTFDWWHKICGQCSPLRQKFMERSIISPALSLLMKHLVIGQCQKAPNFSAFHWSPHGSLVSIGQHFITMRVVHLPKRTETSLITESDQALQAVHNCNSWY